MVHGRGKGGEWYMGVRVVGGTGRVVSGTWEG